MSWHRLPILQCVRRLGLLGLACASLVVTDISQVRARNDAPAPLSTGDSEPQKLELVRLLKERRFTELNARLNDLQTRFENGQINDSQINLAFNAFAHADPALERLFHEWVGLHPKVFASHLGRGVYYMHLAYVIRGEWWIPRTARTRQRDIDRYARRAIADFRTALTLNSHLAPAYAGLMSLYALREQAPSGVIAFSEAQAALPNGRYHVLVAAQLSKDFWPFIRSAPSIFLELAAMGRIFDSRLAILAGYAEYAEALVLRNRRRYGEAASLYDQAIHENRDVSWYFFGRARNSWLQDRNDEALKDLDRALELEPQSARIYDLMARAHRDNHIYELALSFTDRALALDPYHPSYLAARIGILKYLDRWNEAGLLISKALLYGEDHSEVHGERGDFVERHLHDPVKARPIWKRAIELAPYDAYYRRRYWLTFVKMRDCEAVSPAIDYLRTCLSEGECNSSEIIFVSYTMDDLRLSNQCPYDPHFVAKRFWNELSNTDRAQIKRTEAYDLERREQPATGSSNVRSFSISGIGLGQTVADVRRAYPEIRIHNTRLPGSTTPYVSVGRTNTAEGSQELIVVFSHVGTVETVVAKKRETIETTPDQLENRLRDLRKALAAPYGMADHATWDGRTGKHTTDFVQTNENGERIAGLTIEQYPPELRGRENGRVTYFVRVNIGLVDDELAAASKKNREAMLDTRNRTLAADPDGNRIPGFAP